MVNLPLFGDRVGVLFPCFDVRQAEDMTADDFVAAVEKVVFASPFGYLASPLF